MYHLRIEAGVHNLDAMPLLPSDSIQFESELFEEIWIHSLRNTERTFRMLSSRNELLALDCTLERDPMLRGRRLLHPMELLDHLIQKDVAKL